MGEIAEDMINGDACQICGQYFEESYGYSMTCTECGGKGKLIGDN